MAEARTCQKCGSPVPIGSPESLCPRCMLLAGMINSSGIALAEDRLGAAVHATAAASVLDTIGATIGGVPRVLLRDTAVGETSSPIVRPLKGTETSTRYRIDGEIARGGMGAVLKGRDPDLGRDVALKVLREDHRDNADLVRRFVEEAQIGGQLQHPGIVPIYELGTFADRRPFFTMKLVKGQTLADLLGGPTEPGRRPAPVPVDLRGDRQTVAYAHARGVIHRDLKPSNVMVGSFGEVQVMDWGLAKVLPRGGVVDDAQAGKEPARGDVIATARSGSDLDLSHAGSVLGTPATWPPSRPGARSTGSTSGPTSSPWARSSARSSPASRRSPGRSWRDPPQGGARRHGRRPRPAGRLRGRGRADRPGEGLPGRRAGGPAARRQGRGRADHGLPGGRPGAGAGRRAASGPWRWRGPPRSGGGARCSSRWRRRCWR